MLTHVRNSEQPRGRTRERRESEYRDKGAEGRGERERQRGRERDPGVDIKALARIGAEENDKEDPHNTHQPLDNSKKLLCW
jgi:hypothetical protein